MILTVNLVSNPAHYTLQARKGYFAPREDEDAAALADEELERVAFSDNEIHAIPVEIHTRYFKSTPSLAKISVLAHVDLSHFRFRKTDGRNVDSLRVVAVLFDQSGNYVTGQERNIEFPAAGRDARKTGPKRRGHASESRRQAWKLRDTRSGPGV